MSKDKSLSEYHSEYRGGKILPALCSVFGTLILVGVILVCIPITVPKLMGYEIYNIVSGSMEPEIAVGSAVYVEAVEPVNVQEGDIIAFRRGAIAEEGQDFLISGGDEIAEGSVVVTHRVVRNQIVEGWFETKGDANAAADMDKVSYDDLIGRVAYHIPVLGMVSALLTGTVGKMYMICFAACGAMLNMIAGRIREKKRMEIKRDLEREITGGKPG